MQSYPLYMGRNIVDLNGIWQFRFYENELLENVDENSFVPNDVMCVPGAFDTTPAYRFKRGTALYRKEFMLTTDSPRCLLKVGAIGLQARFCIDNKVVGFTNLPYSGVEFEIGSLAAGRHVICVAIDNNLDEFTKNQSAKERMKLFHANYDFYAFGGFYRGISLHQVPETSLERIQVKTVDINRGIVSLKFIFSGNTSNAQQIKYRFNTETQFHTATVKHEEIIECQVPNFQLWSTQNPNLHTVEVNCNENIVIERFGIRTIEAKNRQILLNGKPIYLKGFNRHESHPEFGPATPEAVMIEDLQNLRDLNCNFIRGSHYSQDPRFLDLCDEMGFLVWEESLGWGNKDTQLGDLEFQELTEKETQIMVQNSINHPSVIIWGFLNEMFSNKPEAYQISERLVKAIKSIDETRLVTFACNHVADDICTPLMDIIAYNIYPGWISIDNHDEAVNEIPPEQIKTIEYLRKINPPDKPMIVSEMGCCGIYGQRNLGGAQWTEEFEAEYLDAVISSVASAPEELCGITIWQFNDTLSYHRKGANIRCKPLAFNLAGSFDMFRRRKLSADTVKNWFKKL